MAQASSMRIETLSKHNYETWKIQIEAVLIRNDMWDFVNGEKPKPELGINPKPEEIAAEAAWSKEDRKAKSDLILAISPSELSQVRECKTSREIWLKLESIYASKGPARKATLLKRLTQSKMAEGEDIREYLSNFFDTVDKLKNMEIVINNDLLAVMLLYSLPDSLENFRCAIESRDNLPDIETLRVKITEEYDARIRKADGSSGALFIKHNANVRSKNNSRDNASIRHTSQNKHEKMSNQIVTYKCNICGIRGHKAANCFRKKKKQQDTLNITSYIADTEVEDASDKRWFLDSGSTTHFCKDKQMMQNLRQTVSGLKLATNATSNVTAIGDVKLESWNGKENTTVNLLNTLYVSNLRTNLLSVSKIVDKGDQVLFTKYKAFIKSDKGKIKLVAKRAGDLFYLQEESQQDCMFSSTGSGDVNKWLRKLGHLNARDISLMIKKN